MFRFFEKEIIDGKILLTDENYRHLVKSIRIGSDEIFEVVTKEGVSKCIIDGKYAKVLKTVMPNNEVGVHVRLFQGLSKANKFDEIINACTQIGVGSFIGVEMMRSVSKMGKRSDLKLSRYKKIAEEAAKQSKRDVIPQVLSTIKFFDIREYLLDGLILVPYELEKTRTIAETLREFKGDCVNIVIGPEGGIDETELKMLLKLGAVPVTLGKRILRTEIAAITTCFAVINNIEERKINEI